MKSEIQITTFDVEALRARLRKMSDVELMRDKRQSLNPNDMTSGFWRQRSQTRRHSIVNLTFILPSVQSRLPIHHIRHVVQDFSLAEPISPSQNEPEKHQLHRGDVDFKIWAIHSLRTLHSAMRMQAGQRQMLQAEVDRAESEDPASDENRSRP
jgi:hypothetical protein